MLETKRNQYSNLYSDVVNLEKNIDRFLNTSIENPDPETLFSIEKSIESNVEDLNGTYSGIEITVPNGADLGLIEMLLDITKEDLTEKEVLNSLRIELNRR